MAIIDDPSAYFQNIIWTGNATDDRALTFDGNSDLQPNFTWFKCRSNAANHQLIDSVRGVNKIVNSNDDVVEVTDATLFKSFDSDGITIGTGGVVNDNGRTYCGWNWKEQAEVFDIVSYTGNGSGPRTISHSLGVKPGFMIIKERTNDQPFVVYHHHLGATKYWYLNGASAHGTYEPFFANTEPTSSVFTVDTDSAVNRNGAPYIAYLFGDSSMSKIGSYVGNGNVDGPYIHLGFKPAWILLRKSSAQSWTIQDNKRNPFNTGGNMKALKADTTGTEEDEASHRIDYLSNGFKMRYNWEGNNNNGTSYYYMAFAHNPFVTSSGVPATAR